MNQVIGVSDKGQLPRDASTELSLPNVYLDKLNYRLIFRYYNHNKCELRGIDKKSAKALVNKLDEITRIKQYSQLARDKLKQTGNYAALFTGIIDDVDLYEIKYTKQGRIICYFVSESIGSNDRLNYCCVVAILRKHIKLK